MLGRANNQLSFADIQVSSRLNEKHFILRVDNEIDWKSIGRKLEVLYDPRKGRPGFPPLVMLKTLLLQQWYNLSDPEAEEAICDRLSFQRFLGLSLSDPVPDETTICRFRNKLVVHRLYEQVFEEINKQLEKKGLVIKQGSTTSCRHGMVVDASLVKSHYRASGTGARRDTDATWTVKQEKPHYGYKAHVSVDEGSELIRKLEITPAHVHDSQVFEELVVGDEEVVYADKGYSGEERSEYLDRRGIYCGIMEKAQRGRALEKWQQNKNKRISKVRGAVERCFGVLKAHYGYVRVKYGGLRRNRCHLYLLASAMNLKKMAKLVPA